MSIWRWAHLFSTAPESSRITLGEGETPLVHSRHIGPSCGLSRLFFKLETANPTGSYKDRFASAAISDMVARRKTRCVATSSGNTGSALAAYCAAAGLTCEIAIVETAPLEKLQQMMAYGASIYRIRGFGTSADVTQRVMATIRRMGAAPDAELQVSAFAYSPVGMAGVKTISYELAEQSAGELRHVFVSAGGGGLTLAIARGFEEMGGGTNVHCVQPEGNDTIATPLRNAGTRARAVTCTTQISGLQVASVLDGDDVIHACRRSGGTGHTVTDELVWATQSRLAREEGIFCEPAAAVSVAGALQARAEGLLGADETVCCLITGSGFKDANSLRRMIERDSCPLLESLPEK
jgi:threonine synthase